MSHIKTQIRDAIVAKLIAGVPTVSGRVFASRVLPLKDVPALIVFADDEEAEIVNVGFPSVLQRMLKVMVIARVKMIDGYDDALDDLQLEIEQALSQTVQDYTLGGLVQRVILMSSRQDFDSMGDQNVAELNLMFRADYRTQVNTPDTPY